MASTQFGWERVLLRPCRLQHADVGQPVLVPEMPGTERDPVSRADAAAVFAMRVNMQFREDVGPEEQLVEVHGLLSVNLVVDAGASDERRGGVRRGFGSHSLDDR